MYCSASIETSAAWRSSRISTSGLPPAMRASVRASSSKIWVRFSGRRAAAPVERRVAAWPRSGSRRSRSASGTATAGRPRGRRSRALAARLPVSFAGSSSWMISQKPWYGKARSCSTKRPCSTRICRTPSRASRAPRAAASCRSPARRRPPRTGTRRRSRRSAAAAAPRTPSSRPMNGAGAGRGASAARQDPREQPLRSLSRRRER